ncbi:MAG: hypothetical protein JWM06_2960 [Actinomycetia bacterium]|jgi:hypothetical protein|nr:hypothetical protein [Actinomycetes bacterium]
MSDPVSWKVMERGWKVRDASGKEIGKVDEIRGLPEDDIFDGITVKRGLLGKREYIPAERIAEILEGEVVLAA